MADLVTRLILDGSKFNNELDKSNRKQKSFVQEGSKQTEMFNSAFSATMKLAGGLGIAMTAGEAMTKVIKGSQATNDEYENTIAAMTDTTDTFFSAISRGDFSAFKNGLIGVYEEGKRVAALFDSLGDMTLAFNYKDVKFQGKKSELEEVIRDEKLPKEARDAAFAELQNLYTQRGEDRLNLANWGKDAGKAKAINKLGINKLSDDDIDWYLTTGNDDSKNQVFLEQIEFINSYEKERQKALEESTYGREYKNGAPIWAQAKRDAYDKKYGEDSLEKAFNARFGEGNAVFSDLSVLKDVGKLYQQDDAGRTELYDLFSKWQGAKSQNAQDKLYLKKLENKLYKLEDKPTVKSDSKTTPAEKEIDWMALGKTDRPVISMPEPPKLYNSKRNEELEEEINKTRTLAQVTEELTAAKLALDNAAGNEVVEFKKRIKNLEDEADAINGVKKSNEDNGQALSNIQGILAVSSNLTNQGAGAWLTWGANVMSSISSNMGGLKELVNLLMAKSVAESAAAGPLGWLNAVAAGIAVAGAVASLPKFANGGIVYGRTVAEVGEYAGANSNPEVIAPLSKLKEIISPGSGGRLEVVVSGELKGRGGDLVATINNYSSRKSRG